MVLPTFPEIYYSKIYYILQEAYGCSLRKLNYTKKSCPIPSYKRKVVRAMPSLSKMLYATVSDGSLIKIKRDTDSTMIKSITPSQSLIDKYGTVDLLTLRIVATLGSKQIPQFLLGELVSLVRIVPESQTIIELFSGRISSISSIKPRPALSLN